MQKNVLLIHGGGPTAVINGSLYGAVTEAKKDADVKHIYAAIGGTGGFLKEKLRDLKDVPDETLKLLLQTPGSAIGTSRDELEAPEYERMTQLLKKHEINCVLMNGGNGTMDTCGKLAGACEKAGADVSVMGIPKTMDNDIAVTDHSPGYGSAARYVAESTRELAADIKGLPIHVCVMETSGRNAGWITAAAALAARTFRAGQGLEKAVFEEGVSCENDESAADLIYLPERPFSEEEFLTDVSNLLKKKSGILVVASEGLKNKDGGQIVEPIFKTGRATYFGDVSAYLANLVIKKLSYKARGEKPGLLGRASIHLQSKVDLEEAILAGRVACAEVLKGTSGKMVAFKRLSTQPYQVETFLVDIDEVMLTEKTMPVSFINERGNGVTKEFVDWCKPLLGAELPEMISFQ